jgi:hypothetical protein
MRFLKEMGNVLGWKDRDDKYHLPSVVFQGNPAVFEAIEPFLQTGTFLAVRIQPPSGEAALFLPQVKAFPRGLVQTAAIVQLRLEFSLKLSTATKSAQQFRSQLVIEFGTCEKGGSQFRELPGKYIRVNAVISVFGAMSIGETNANSQQVCKLLNLLTCKPARIHWKSSGRVSVWRVAFGFHRTADRPADDINRKFCRNYQSISHPKNLGRQNTPSSNI